MYNVAVAYETGNLLDDEVSSKFLVLQNWFFFS